MPRLLRHDGGRGRTREAERERLPQPRQADRPAAHTAEVAGGVHEALPATRGEEGAAANARWANSTKADAKSRAIDEEKAQDAAERAAASASCAGDPTLAAT